MACTESTAFRQKLQKQLDAAVQTRESPWVEVEFNGTDGSRISGLVKLVPQSTPPFIRQVTGITCDEVIQALSLSFELFLEELAGQERERLQLPCEPDPRSRRDRFENWPGPDIDPFTLPPAGYRERPAPDPQVPTNPPLGSAQGNLTIGGGILPGASLGLGLSYRARIEKEFLVLVGLHHHLGAPEIVGEEMYAFSATALSLSFGRYIVLDERLRLTLAAGPRLNMLHVGWADQTARWTHHLGASLGTSVDFGLHFPSGWSTGLRGDALLQVLRARFVSESNTELWVQPWIGGELGWFLAANFW